MHSEGPAAGPVCHINSQERSGVLVSRRLEKNSPVAFPTKRPGTCVGRWKAPGLTSALGAAGYAHPSTAAQRRRRLRGVSSAGPYQPFVLWANGMAT